MIKIRNFTPEELDRFHDYQRRSYHVLQTVAAELRPGVSEKDVSYRLRRAFHEDGVRTYFHVPVTLFGERTAYPGDFGQFEALATDRRLAPGDTVILDAAPVYDGYTVDSSYTFSLKPDNETFQLLDQRLQELRELILQFTRERRSMRHICWAVGDQIKAWGLENCHRKHIAAVLGHRVTRSTSRLLGNRQIWGLAPRQVGYFFLATSLAGVGFSRLTPNWNHAAVCDCPPQPGLWAMEPHLAKDGVGVKFEEIMVVTDNDAYWLDDDLPHHRRWQDIMDAQLADRVGGPGVTVRSRNLLENCFASNPTELIGCRAANLCLTPCSAVVRAQRKPVRCSPWSGAVHNFGFN